MSARLAFLLALVLALPAGAETHDLAPAVAHDVTIDLDPARGRLEGISRITVTGRRELALYLYPSLRIDALEIDGEAEPFEAGQRPLVIRLPRLPREESSEVLIRYSGPLAGDAGGAFLDPRGAFLPERLGWMPETEDESTDYRLAISAPEPYRAIATGRLVEERSEKGRHKVVVAGQPGVSAPAVFAGRFQVEERRHGGILLRTYFPATAEALAPRYLDSTARYLDIFDERIGPYPYDAFHVVAGPLPVGLGFPGLTYISDKILHLPFMQGRSLAHEIAHNWWGNAVEIDYASGNWAEGLTTFMADYALTVENGPAAAREMRLGWLRDYAALPTGLDRPVTSFVSKTHDAQQVIGYNKTAFFFHMLEQELTPEVFAEGIRGFWQAQKFRRAGWDELRAAFEAAADRELSWFFAQWLERPGAPELQLGEVAVNEEAGGRRLSFTLSQKGSPFRLTVPVQIETEDGSRTLRVALKGAEAEVSERLEARPKALRIDPDYDLFRRLASGEATPILRDVTLNPEARVVLATGADAVARQAAEDLAGRLVRGVAATPTGVEPAAAVNGPLLIVGLESELPETLTAHRVSPMPKALDGRGSARAWTRRRDDGVTALIVAAKDAESLALLLRPLPHYRRYGYVVFEGSKAVDKGVWPAADSPLVKRFD
ncbi:MAG: M1 family peptidase [Kiloniellales bacterium]|nr:M1 family peptidase [Kiloniellales bacterium]